MDTVSKFLDEHLYRHMDALIHAPGLDGPVRIQRVRTTDPLAARGTSLVLWEGPWKTNLREDIQIVDPDRPADGFSIRLSFLKGEEPLPGWLLDEQKTAEGILFCSAAGPAGPVKILLVFIGQIKSYLASLGHDRAILCQREAMIRESGFPGRRNTKDPDLWYSFSTRPWYQPVDIVIRTSRLEQLARASLEVSCDGGQDNIHGVWFGRPISATFPLENTL